MTFEVKLSEQATEDLGRLGRDISDQIIDKLDQYQASGNPLKFSKPLHGDLKGFFRFRIGDYRAIFRKEPSGRLIILFIITIKNRKEVYE